MIVYLFLRGRIGNQMFQYAFARTIQKKYGKEVKLVINESSVLEDNWVNSLKKYPLPAVKYVDDSKYCDSPELRISYKILKQYYRFVFHRSGKVQHLLEKIFQPIMNKFGVIAIRSGYVPYKLNTKRSVILDGYFQCEKFFEENKEEISSLFDLSAELDEIGYPFIDMIRSRNTICISIKVEHNADNPKFNVCHEDYYIRAIEKISKEVSDPLFFLCSDNVEYAKKRFFPKNQYDIIVQPEGFEVQQTLAAMSLCKYFVINNTSFGWWAQYLSKSKNKIVVAPSKWKNDNSAVGIYENQKTWQLIEV